MSISAPVSIPDDLAPLAEVALRLRLSISTLRRWLRTGKLSGYRVGVTGPWRVSWRAVAGLLEEPGGEARVEVGREGAAREAVERMRRKGVRM